MSVIDLTAAVEAAAEKVADFDDRGHIFRGRYPHHEDQRVEYRKRAEAAVRAAAPVIERAANLRANEAARLSAQARDDADSLRAVIGALREQLEIVESDRTDFDAWTVKVAIKHGLPDEPETRDTIARYLDEVVAERDRLRAAGGTQ